MQFENRWSQKRATRRTASPPAGVEAEGYRAVIIPGIAYIDSTKVLELVQRHTYVGQVVLYGSEALGRHPQTSTSMRLRWSQGNWCNWAEL